MTHRRPLFVASLAAVAAAAAMMGSGCDGLGEPTAVTVGARTFTVSDLRAIHARMDAGQRLTLSTGEERTEFADAVIERTLLEEFGEQLIASGQANIDVELLAARHDLLVRRLRTVEGSDVALDSTTVRNAYERMRTTHRVKTLLFGDESAARAARERIPAGQGLDALPEYARRGGHETWISWSPLPDPLADLLTGHATGEVLGPVASRGWWLLTEIVEQGPADLETYAVMRPRILRGLRVREEAMRVRELLDRLIAESGLRVEENAIRMLVEKTRAAVLREGASEGDGDWAVPRLDAAEGATVVARWSTGSVTADDYVTSIARLPRGQRPRSGGLETVVRMIVQESGERRLLVAESVRRGLERDWWVERAIEVDRSDRMIRLAAQHIDREHAQRDNQDDLVRTMRETQPQLFRRDARARVLRFDHATRDLAESELAAIRRAGGGRQRLRELVSAELPAPGTYHVLELEYSAIGEPTLRDAIFDGPLEEPAGPFEALGIWVVVVPLEVIPSREMSEEEIRGSGFATARVSSGIPDWIRRRRTEVGVSIDHDALEAIGPGG